MAEARTVWPYKYDDFICTICCKQAKSSDCELLEGTVLEVLEVVLINLNLSTIQPVICKDCNIKLLDAFQHKSKWIYTEDQLFPYINSAIDGKVDIKTAYFNENDCKQCDIEMDICICRLCMKLISDNSWNMLDVLEKQYSLEIFEKYVPELNLSITENPIICKMCLDSLDVFMGFIAFYQGQGMKTEDYFEAKDETKPISIYSEKIEDLKQNNMECNSMYREILKYTKRSYVSKDKAQLLKHPLIGKAKKQAKLFNSKIISNQSSFNVNAENHLPTHPMKSLKCITCEFRTNKKSDLKKHERRHKSALINQQLVETKIFQCALCSYTAKQKAHLQSHDLIHKPLSQLEVFKCELCSYKTKYKGNLRNHTLGHNAKVYTCEFCFFETKYKGNFQNHVLMHKPVSEMEAFKCEFCTFETKYKQSLQNHILIHKSLSEVEVFSCEFCSFKTKHKGNLPRHILIHKPRSEVEVFKCEFCTFDTKFKGILQTHILIHKPLSEVEVFKCEFCSFETKRKGTLKLHVLIHKPLSEVEVFNCEFCSYETKYKRYIRQHVLIHKKVEIF